MLIIFKKTHGDFAEDSYETIETILQIKGKGLTEQKVLDEYHAHIKNLADSAGVKIEPIVGGYKRGKNLTKLMQENTLIDFAKKRYNAKEVPDHIEIYIA